MDRNALAELLQALESRRDAEERRREERYTALIERVIRPVDYQSLKHFHPYFVVCVILGITVSALHLLDTCYHLPLCHTWCQTRDGSQRADGAAGGTGEQTGRRGEKERGALHCAH
ncbi:UNVERIFIED_CONTAM: hypothetical protein FKN15_044383 [Acipenser sinensis]